MDSLISENEKEAMWVRYGFDMDFLDSGNENEAKSNFIGTLRRSNAESSLVLFYQV
jgi:hypothetical protein